MSLFAKRPTPDDCTTRVSNAMNEVELIRDLLDATSQPSGYKADWSADRAYAHEHLREAWSNLGGALNGLLMSGRRPTWNEQTMTWIEVRHALEAQMEQLKAAVEMAEARASLAELREVALKQELAKAGAALSEAISTEDLPKAQAPEPDRELARRVRRLVASALHPDKATSGPESEWRTKLCQSLFPELDQVMSGA